MIEIVFDKDDKTEDNIFAGITLPKNVRQIGTVSGNRRIYIEDYVMTYLRKLANPNSSYARGAILLGEVKSSEYGQVVFVSGALAAQNLEFDLEETTFDGETWSYIYQEVKQYFPELQVVGWFLSRMGFSTEVNDMIVKLHMDNFAGDDKILYVLDALDNEDAFYMTENDCLHKQSGYYIYYARNEAMQNFMVESKKSEMKEINSVDTQDEAVINNYKKIMGERARNAKLERMNRRLSAICSGLTVAVLALGIAVFSNYQMLEVMQTKLVENGIISYNDTVESKSTNQLAQNGKTEMKQTKQETTQVSSDIAKPDTTRLSATEYPQYYIVQNGDTLSSISFKMYNSVDYVEELMTANEFSEADQIHEGDTILIPTVGNTK